MRRSAGIGLGVLVLVGLLAERRPAGQTATPAAAAAQWGDATDAWSAGDYPAALQQLLTLMRSPAAPDYLERVALLTGELFLTSDVVPDGRNVRLANTGDVASYETGLTAAPVTRLIRVGGGTAPRMLAELKGTGAAFSRDGAKVAYLKLIPSTEWTAAAKAYDAAASPADRTAAQATLNFVMGKSEIVVRDVASGVERPLRTAGFVKSTLTFAPDGAGVLFIGSLEPDVTRSNVYLASDARAPVAVTDRPGFKTNLLVDPTGGTVVYTSTDTVPFRRPGSTGPLRTPPAGEIGACFVGSPAASPAFGVVDVKARSTRTYVGAGVRLAAGGSAIAWLFEDGDECLVQKMALPGGEPVSLQRASRIGPLAISPDGSQVAYQMRAGNNWDIFIGGPGDTPRRITRDLQHDVQPQFLTNETLLAVGGEPRGFRSFLYALPSGTRTRLFSNNTVRTINPEYVWRPNAAGDHVLVQADRDGDTISPERGWYVVDLTRPVTAADVVARLERQFLTETELRQRMTAAFAPLAPTIRPIVARAAPNRVYDYERTLVEFDSKDISQPGNAKAIDYLMSAYRSFGYAPETQWIDPAPMAGVRTGNVIAVKKGTESPDVIYIVSSHFDSVEDGPGADDDTSGTAALLEAARILAQTPLPATVVFASLTGEETGLYGSKELVKRAKAANWKVAGALNNDMIGWNGDGARLANTIRFMSPGMRDVQHGAAFLFTRLVTYDARYYRGTDAQSYVDAWGDMVSGLGSYPILANPNYHAPTDVLETVSIPQVVEAAKTTAASIVYLASSPSRVVGVKTRKIGSGIEVTWTANPEADISRYVVAYGPAGDPFRSRATATTTLTTIPSVPAGTVIAVRAVNARGLEGWDWTRTVLQ